MGCTATKTTKNKQFKGLISHDTHQAQYPITMVPTALFQLKNQFDIGHQKSPATRP
jgi:hypothetical protein